MSSKTNIFENQLLLHVFQNADISLIGDATGLRGSTAPGNIYISLHTADPGEAGDQTTNEANYGGYTRVAVPRTVGGWTVTNNLADNVNAITFPQVTSGSNTITHVGIGTSASGAGKLLFKAPIGSILGAFFGVGSTDAFEIQAHALIVDDRVTFMAVTGGVLPTGLTEGTVYWVKTVPDADHVTISATQGGATLNITTDGEGVAMKVLPLAATVGVIPEFAAGALDITED